MNSNRLAFWHLPPVWVEFSLTASLLLALHLRLSPHKLQRFIILILSYFLCSWTLWQIALLFTQQQIDNFGTPSQFFQVFNLRSVFLRLLLFPMNLALLFISHCPQNWVYFPRLSSLKPVQLTGHWLHETRKHPQQYPWSLQVCHFILKCLSSDLGNFAQQVEDQLSFWCIVNQKSLYHPEVMWILFWKPQDGPPD